MRGARLCAMDGATGHFMAREEKVDRSSWQWRMRRLWCTLRGHDWKGRGRERVCLRCRLTQIRI